VPLFPSLGRKDARQSGLQTKIPERDARDLADIVSTERKEIILMRGNGDTVFPATRGYGGRWTIERAIKEAYERVTWVYRAVSVIAAQQSKLPMGRARRDTPASVSDDITFDWPLLEILNGQANSLEVAHLFRRRLVAQLLLSRRGAFVEQELSKGGDVLSLRLLPPDRTEPVPDAEGNLVRFEVRNMRGDVIERLDPDHCRWFRNPHPTDPWRSMTPLESAGLTVELDYFARVFARSFVINDGRPGMLIGIKDGGDASDQELDRVERKFGSGVTAAGRTTVISGDLTAVDMSTNPREAAYLETRGDTKTEILTAFGVPESIAGNASGRTFANSDQELENFWTITMDDALTLVSAPWHADVGDGYALVHDVSKVEALQRGRHQAADRAQIEWEQGLITVDEYREATGRDPFNIPASRALWLPGTRYWVGATDADNTALGKLQGQHGPAAAPGAGPASAAAPGATTGAVPHAAALNGTTGRAGRSAAPRSALSLVSAAGRKALPSGEAKAAAKEDAPDFADAEDELARIVTAFVKASAERLSSEAARRGTVWWEPAGKGQLDLDKVLQADRWKTKAATALGPLLAGHAAAGAATVDRIAGQTKAADDQAEPEDDGQAAQAAATAAALALLADGFAALADRLKTRYAAALGATKPDRARTAAGSGRKALAAIAGRIVAGSDGLIASARDLAHSAARVAAVEAGDARATALQKTAGKLITKTWQTRRDALVRPAHAKVLGQVRPVGKPFDVGGAKLRYPGDPAGPPHLTRNCRCWPRYGLRRPGQNSPT
jgi:HK97 family phage portal protein